jgi:hypothetical protein
VDDAGDLVLYNKLYGSIPMLLLNSMCIMHPSCSSEVIY